MQTEFKFKYFGPLLVEAKIDSKFYTFLESVVDSTYRNGQEFKHTINGLHDEWELKSNNISTLNKFIQPYIHGYRQTYWNHWRPGWVKDEREMYIGNAWINYQRPGEYRDPHVHSGCDLSFVIYYDMPELIKEEARTQGSITPSTPGSITFTSELSTLKPEEMFPTISEVTMLPDSGTIVIFPWYLTHRVTAFKSDTTRITIAGNIVGDR